MPATTFTKELFAKAQFSLAEVSAERDLRIQAGAIRSSVDDSDALNYVLSSEWNVIGGNDAAAPAPAGSNAPANPIQTALENLVVQREGRRNTVYLDSLDKPTVGIGHLVDDSDHLNVGDTISNDQVDAFFRTDSAAAMRAAVSQAAEAGITDTTFLPYLASVNFQLGVSWTSEFFETWPLIVSGQYQKASDGLRVSKWAQQTPVRVKDFQDALLSLPPKPGTV
jgi:GH24 family phage-related lysozyme (muramidase)